MTKNLIEVIQPGITTIQDRGRHGLQDHGMPPSGVFDPFLSAIANRLAGNDPATPLLEFALAGPSLKFHTDCWFAITAHAANFELDDTAIPLFSAVHAAAGSTLRFRRMEGWFGYIAFDGGINSATVFGSASTYERGRIGGRLQKKLKIETAGATGTISKVRIGVLGLNKNRIVPILPGIHYSRFPEREHDVFVSTHYRISLQSDRMGIRLDGAGLSPVRLIRSVPALPGAIQVTNSGLPVILGPEGPVTGGYPQIAMLPEISWTALAGIPPGQQLRFDWIDVEHARQMRYYRNSILYNDDVWEKL